MSKYLYALILILFAAVLISPVSATWLSGYNYEKTITFTTSGWSANVTNPQVYFTIYRSSGTDSGSNLYLGTGILSNFSDIRFTDSSDNLLNYWVQSVSGTSSEIVYVKVPSLNTTGSPSIKVYYQNSTATSVSTNATFYDFDDFNGASLNATKWSSYGTVNIGSSICDMYNFWDGSNRVPSYITYNTALGPGYFYIINSTRTIQGVHNDGSSLVVSTYFKFQSMGYNYIYRRSGGNWYSTSDGAATSGYVINAVKFGSSNVLWNTDGTNSYNTQAYDSATAAMQLKSPGSYYTDTSYKLDIDYVAIGKCGDSEPTYSYGSQQTPTTTAFTANVTTIAPNTWVQFNDTSSGTPDHWWWSFGDGNTSTTQNATNQYPGAGFYTVSLVSQAAGINNTLTKSNYIAVGQAPIASFSVNKSTGTAPITIGFTDTSLYTPTVWNWSWGEGGANTTTQNAAHQYMSSGTYTVMFTAANAYGSSSSSETLTFQSSNNASGYGQYYASKTTTFHIQSAFGTPVSGATVTMQGIQTSTGSFDWLGQLLGVKFNETPIENTAMSTLTDSNGDAQFIVLPSVLYNVTIYQSGVISKTFTVTPTDDRYTIPLDWSIFGTTGKDVNAVDSFNMTSTKNSATLATLTITGSDTSGHLTGGTLNVTLATNGTETSINYQTLPSGNFTLNIPVSDYAGNSYYVHIIATQSDYGTVKHDFGITFPKAKQNPLNLDDKTLFQGCMIVLFLLAGIFTATTKDKGALITCFAAWIMFGLGYMDYVGSVVMFAALSFATVMSILFIIAVRRERP
jgi:PKD repeat protein